MTFIYDCMYEHNIECRDWEIEREKATDEMAEKATREFHRLFGEYDIEVEKKTDLRCSINCQGISFICKSRDELDVTFYMPRLLFCIDPPCIECGEAVDMFETRFVRSKADVGSVLDERNMCSDCDTRMRELWKKPKTSFWERRGKR